MLKEIENSALLLGIEEHLMKSTSEGLGIAQKQVYADRLSAHLTEMEARGFASVLELIGACIF